MFFIQLRLAPAPSLRRGPSAFQPSARESLRSGAATAQWRSAYPGNHWSNTTCLAHVFFKSDSVINNVAKYHDDP